MNTLDSVIIKNPQDIHAHLVWYTWDIASQANEVLESSFCFSRILSVPNVLLDHTKTPEEVKKYMQLVEEAMPMEKHTETISTLSLKPETTPETIIQAKKQWIQAIKYSLWWVPANSPKISWDIGNPQINEVLQCMEKEAIVLYLHSERIFTSIIEKLAETYPNLKIVVEDIRTKENALLIWARRYPNIYWIVTPQRLMFTTDNMEKEDQITIQKLVLSWNPNVCFWSDSVPYSIELITHWFLDPKTIQLWIDNWLLSRSWYLQDLQGSLQAFISGNACNIYWNINPENKKIITLKREPFQIPEDYWEKLMWPERAINYKVSKVVAETRSWTTDLLK